MNKLIILINSLTNKQLRDLGILLTITFYKQLDNPKLKPTFSTIIKHFKKLDKPDYKLIYDTQVPLDELEYKIVHTLYALFTDIYLRHPLKTCFTNACDAYNINTELITNAAKTA